MYMNDKCENHIAFIGLLMALEFKKVKRFTNSAGALATKKIITRLWTRVTDQLFFNGEKIKLKSVPLFAFKLFLLFSLLNMNPPELLKALRDHGLQEVYIVFLIYSVYNFLLIV